MDMTMNVFNIDKIVDKTINIVTRVCNICNEREFPDASMSSNAFWICPKCCRKIRKLIITE